MNNLQQEPKSPNIEIVKRMYELFALKDNPAII